MTDPELLAKRLALIETCVSQLRILARPDAIAHDIREQRFVEHTLQIAIQAALDVASLVVSDRGQDVIANRLGRHVDGSCSDEELRQTFPLAHLAQCHLTGRECLKASGLEGLRILGGVSAKKPLRHDSTVDCSSLSED